MDARELSGMCPLCREKHAGYCTVLSTMSIVFYEVDETTTPEELATAEAAYLRAAQKIADHHDA
jgi:hypothetical protein